MIESYPNDIYECIYPVDYTNYYFLSFCMFLEFIKPNIKTSPGINKFIIDLFKYFYIYSYYDYYFYYSNNLFESIMSTYYSKNKNMWWMLLIGCLIYGIAVPFMILKTLTLE